MLRKVIKYYLPSFLEAWKSTTLVAKFDLSASIWKGVKMSREINTGIMIIAFLSILKVN